MEGEWTIVRTDMFAKQMKIHSRNQEMLKKLDELLELFRYTDDPRRVGDRKAGRLSGVYTAKLSKQNRLMYEVIDTKHEIRLLKIEDHRQVYGRG